MTFSSGSSAVLVESNQVKSNQSIVIEVLILIRVYMDKCEDALIDSLSRIPLDENPLIGSFLIL